MFIKIYIKIGCYISGAFKPASCPELPVTASNSDLHTVTLRANQRPGALVMKYVSYNTVWECVKLVSLAIIVYYAMRQHTEIQEILQ